MLCHYEAPTFFVKQLNLKMFFSTIVILVKDIIKGNGNLVP